MQSSLRDALESLFKASDQDPETVLHDVVRLVGEALHADRCFLCIRNPATRQSRIAFVWRRDDLVPDVQPGHREWADETALPAEDPLYAAALACRPSVYVDDVQTAPSDVLNREFEARTFGHRALIHGHVVAGGTLWGILQPSVFGRPRTWTEQDRVLVETLLPQLVALIRGLVQNENSGDYPSGH